MSHFVFGTLEGSRVPSREKLGSNIEACWGVDAQQGFMLEMLAADGKSAIDETPFCLVAVGEDTADALVSPYRCELAQIVDHLDCMLAWLDKERAGKNAELWVTEGYDDAFSFYEGTYEKLRAAVGEVLQASTDVPSLRLRLCARQTDA